LALREFVLFEKSNLKKDFFKQMILKKKKN